MRIVAAVNYLSGDYLQTEVCEKYGALPVIHLISGF